MLMKEISQAVVEGDKLYSQSLYFYPKKITSGVYKAECFTAASMTLMTQSLIPTLTFGNKTSEVTLKVSFLFLCEESQYLNLFI